MLKRNLLVLIFMFLLTVLCAGRVMAESYQVEVELGYESTKEKPKTGDDTEGTYLNGFITFNFEKVSLEGRPYEEAYFLQKTGLVYLIGSSFEIEKGSAEDDGRILGGGVDYVFKPLPLYLGFEYIRNDMEGDTQAADYELTSNNFIGKVGAHLGDNFRVYLAYEKDNTELKAGSLDVKLKENNFFVSFKLVQDLDSQMFINVEGTVKRISAENDFADTKEVNTETEILADFYIMPQLSIGAGFELNSGEDKSKEGNAISFRTKGYFIPNAALSFRYEMFKAKDTDEGDDQDTFEIGLTGRF
jgi:hypothetical protein